MRKTRNLVPSGASVRIRPTSITFARFAYPFLQDFTKLTELNTAWELVSQVGSGEEKFNASFFVDQLVVSKCCLLK